jgi:nucleotide-binding universal stress UspA family protein
VNGEGGGKAGGETRRGPGSADPHGKRLRRRPTTDRPGEPSVHEPTTDAADGSIADGGGAVSFERVLLPTDGSAISRPAERRAIELASEAGASLVVLHVLELYGPPLEEHRDALRDELTREARAFVDRIVERATDAGVADATGTVEEGRAPEEIVAVATERDCDVVVMGTHGRANHQPYVLGSVTARVLQESPVEVLVVPTKGTD